MWKLYLADAAEVIGVRVSTLHGYRSRGAARFPEPDGVDIEAGHARPWWSRSTLEGWLRQRPGRGNWGPRHAGDAIR